MKETDIDNQICNDIIKKNYLEIEKKLLNKY
jgi:hypothetical protein